MIKANLLPILEEVMRNVRMDPDFTGMAVRHSVSEDLVFLQCSLEGPILLIHLVDDSVPNHWQFTFDIRMIGLDPHATTCVSYDGESEESTMLEIAAMAEESRSQFAPEVYKLMLASHNLCRTFVSSAKVLAT